MEDIKEKIIWKINISEKFKYFKSMWIFILITLIIFNIVLFYFLNGIIYSMWLIIWNIIFFWVSISIAIFLWKTYLIDAWVQLVSEMKNEAQDFVDKKTWEWNVIKTIKEQI